MCFHVRVTDDSVAIPAHEYYAKRVRHYLAERGMDERVLANVPVYPAGMTQATFARDMGGLVGGLAGAGSSTGMSLGGTLGRVIGRDLNRAQGGGIVNADIKFPKRSMLVLTSERLLFFSIYSMGFFSGKPKKEAAVDIPLEDVVQLSEPMMKQAGAMKVMRLDIGVRDRGFVSLEVPQVSIKKGVALVDEVYRRARLIDAPQA